MAIMLNLCIREKKDKQLRFSFSVFALTEKCLDILLYISVS